jgi:hypothetical protein
MKEPRGLARLRVQRSDIDTLLLAELHFAPHRNRQPFQTWRRTELISSAPSLLIVEIAGPIENRRSLPLDPGRLLAMQMHLDEISRTVARGAVQWETPCANFAQQACRSRQSQCSVIIAYKVKAQHIVMFAFF